MTDELVSGTFSSDILSKWWLSYSCHIVDSLVFKEELFFFWQEHSKCMVDYNQQSKQLHEVAWLLVVGKARNDE